MILSALGIVGSAAAVYSYFRTRAPTEIPPWRPFEYVTLSNKPATLSLTTFNTLASCYVYDNFIIYAPLKYLWFSYRSMLLSRFLANFTTDFICLQEVDMTDWFANELKKNGYDSIAKKRTSNRADHCLLAWKSEEWELLSSEEIEFDQTEHASRDPEYYRRGNVAILGSFRHRTTELPVLVISAHLVASPKYEGTKYAQAQMLLERIAAYSIPNILVAGDFNSNERSNVYRVMTGLPPDYMASTERGYTRKNETEVRAIAKPMPIALKSAYANYHEGEHPNLTINHFCFTGVLDFIFHNEGMEPVKLLKTPAPAEVEGYTPNAYFPSDHYALQAYFTV